MLIIPCFQFQDQGLKRLPMAKRKKAQANRKKKAPKDNEHLADVLEDYDERGKKVQSQRLLWLILFLLTIL